MQGRVMQYKEIKIIKNLRQIIHLKIIFIKDILTDDKLILVHIFQMTNYAIQEKPQ